MVACCHTGKWYPFKNKGSSLGLDLKIELLYGSLEIKKILDDFSDQQIGFWGL